MSLRLPALLDGQFTNGDRADVPGLLRPGSRCTACLTPLRFYQNIPIASFIFLSGRCGFCTARISPRYPVIELIAAVTAVTLGVVYEPDWQLAAVMFFACALLTLSLIDIDHQVLPDLLVLPLLWTGLLFNSLSLFVDLHSAVFGAVAGYLVLWLSCQAHHILTGRAGMGHGDFKLFAAIGAWLGVTLFLSRILTISSFWEQCNGFILFRDFSMLHRLQLTVPVIINNIYIIRMLLKRSIPGNKQNQGFPRDFVIYSAQ